MSKREDPDFETRVCGIPCGVVIDSVDRGWPGSRFEPPEPPTIEFHLVDRRGYTADWLTSKMSASDEFDVVDEAWAHLQDEAYEMEVARYGV